MPHPKETSAQKRQRHIREMREKLERHTGQPSSLFVSQDLSPEDEEKFLEHVIAIEEADPVVLFDELEKGGMTLPPSDSLDDEQLHAKLWETIHGMALLGHYLYNTDHLSDRDLYEHLCNVLLREPTSVWPGNPDFACHINILGGCSMEDIQLYLTYYADEEERSQWAKDWPEDILPAHKTPPYDRDRHLPGPTYGIPRSHYSS
jgi:hypothetical protein